MPLGVLLAMKTLKDEWYVVINAYRFMIEICIIYYVSVLFLHNLPTLHQQYLHYHT